MIADVDEVLRKLLSREIDIKGNEIDINFDMPKREWSSRLSKPTINLFLYDIRENLRLRGSEQYRTIQRDDGTSEIRRNPVRISLRYLMTAWVKEAEDEHILLSNALMGFFRNPFVPDDLLPESMRNQPSPVPIEVANFPNEHGPMEKFSELWGVLDNELHPATLVIVTVSMDPYKPLIVKQVKSREMRFVQDQANGRATPNGGGPAPEESKMVVTRASSKAYWAVAGKLISEKYDLSTLSAVLVEKQAPLSIDAGGNFSLHGIVEGEYHIDILFNKKVLKRQKILVPAPDGYDIQV